MTDLPVNKYYLFNSELHGLKQFDGSKNDGGVYEVIRVIKGIPLFLEDHLERFFHSAQIAQKTIPFTDEQIKSFLKSLVDKNKVSEGNILVSFKTNLEAFFVQHSYPGVDMYRDGIVCGVLKAERENPNAKVFKTMVRQRADQILAEKKFYEVLLVDHLGKVTEGSRSNVFFVAGAQLVTSPGSKVLLGITRQKTVQLAKELNIEIIEREVGFSELSSFDAAFITGTSPKLLPIKLIDAFKFDSENKLMRQLMKSYEDLIEKYLIEAK